PLAGAARRPDEGAGAVGRVRGSGPDPDGPQLSRGLPPGLTASPMRLHLVDGTYELFRAHFSKRPDHRGPDGRDAKATLGVAASLLSLLHDRTEAVSHIAV